MQPPGDLVKEAGLYAQEQLKMLTIPGVLAWSALRVKVLLPLLQPHQSFWEYVFNTTARNYSAPATQAVDLASYSVPWFSPMEIYIDANMTVGGTSGFGAEVTGWIDPKAGSCSLAVKHAGGWSPMSGEMAANFRTPPFEALLKINVGGQRFSFSADVEFPKVMDIVPGYLQFLAHPDASSDSPVGIFREAAVCAVVNPTLMPNCTCYSISSGALITCEYSAPTFGWMVDAAPIAMATQLFPCKDSRPSMITTVTFTLAHPLEPWMASAVSSASQIALGANASDVELSYEATTIDNKTATVLKVMTDPSTELVNVSVPLFGLGIGRIRLEAKVSVQLEASAPAEELSSSGVKASSNTTESRSSVVLSNLTFSPRVTIDMCLRVNDLELCGEEIPICKDGFFKKIFRRIRRTLFPMDDIAWVALKTVDDPTSLRNLSETCATYTKTRISEHCSTHTSMRCSQPLSCRLILGVCAHRVPLSHTMTQAMKVRGFKVFQPVSKLAWSLVTILRETSH